MSPDGRNERQLSKEQWLVHTWSRDGSEIIGIKETDDLRLSVIGVTVKTTKETVLADLGRSFAFNNPVKGLTLMDGGRTLATSIIRPRGDLWLAEGIERRSRLARVLSFDPVGR